MAYALDANCLIRWLLDDNPQQSGVIGNLLAASPNDLHVADLAIAETAWVLKSVYKFDDTMIEGFLRKIIEHQKINCNRNLFGTVLNNLNSSPKVSLVDLCLARYAELGGLKLLTFDKTLTKKLPKLVKLAE